jgi:hypothetical protein
LLKEKGVMMINLFDPAFIQSDATGPEMTTGGWIFMVGAWVSILSLVIFCFSKILLARKKKGELVKDPTEIESVNRER